MSTRMLPTAFPFRFRFPVARNDRLPKSGKKILGLNESFRIPFPADLEGQHCVVSLRSAWNPHGIGFEFQIKERTIPPMGDPENPTRPDSLQLWIDTRNTQSVHRATRFCHHFCLLPTGGGTTGSEATAVQLPVARAKEDAPVTDSEDFLVRRHTQTDGYRLEFWIPAEALHGYDPLQQPLIGFSCRVNDAEHGRLPFALADDFPVESDPSLWHTLELIGS